MNIMKKALFIDRDGTLIKEPADEQIDAFEKLAFVPGVMRNLAFIRQKLDYEFVMVSNQDGLGTDAFLEDTFWPVHNLMMRTLEGEGVTFDDVLIDRSFPEENLPTRKPGTAMLGRYTSGGYDMEACWVIGDRETDAQLALNLGCRALILKEKDEDSFSDERIRYVDSWDRIAEILFAGERKARVRRTTKETDIEVRLDLDGSGRCDIRTGLGFFDHMLEQIGKHGGKDLYIDCLCSVALDCGGRPGLVWDAEFRREKVGEMPTEMFLHFFKSLSDAARMNLNIKAEGVNEHHKIEGIFKALARSLKMAVRRDIYHYELPSSKGVL